MYPTFTKVVEYMRAGHAGHAGDLAGVMQSCFDAGFAPVFIMHGLEKVFQIPPGETKRLVVSHFFRGEARSALERLHAVLEEDLLRDEFVAKNASADAAPLP